MATAALSERESHADALVELVREGQLTWAAAVMMYRNEFELNYAECVDDGIVEKAQEADVVWRKNVLHIRSNLHKLAHVK